MTNAEVRDTEQNTYIIPLRKVKIMDARYCIEKRARKSWAKRLQV